MLYAKTLKKNLSSYEWPVEFGVETGPELILRCEYPRERNLSRKFLNEGFMVACGKRRESHFRSAIRLLIVLWKSGLLSYS